MNKPLSKYQRKNMTQEEIKEYESEYDEDGYKLIDTEDYCGYVIETWEHPTDSDPYKVWNDFDDRTDWVDTLEEVARSIEITKGDIDDEIAYYDEEEETE